MKKLQNYFKDFLPQNYREFRSSANTLASNPAVVAELLRICCENDDVKAIKMAFERILGKPEKVVVIKRTTVKLIYPDAREKHPKPAVDTRAQDETTVATTKKQVVISEDEAPGQLLRKMFDKIGERGREYAYEVIDKKNLYTVAEVMVANLYAIAMRGGHLGAIQLLFDYLDGAVADVVRIEGENTVLIENYADIAPYEAIKGDDGIYYVEKVVG